MNLQPNDHAFAEMDNDTKESLKEMILYLEDKGALRIDTDTKCNNYNLEVIRVRGFQLYLP